MNQFSKIWGYVVLACAAFGAWYANNIVQQRKGKQELKSEINEERLDAIRENEESRDDVRAMPRDERIAELQRDKT